MNAGAIERAQRAALLSLIMTTVVVGVKLAAGIFTGAVSVLAEAMQSSVDVLIAFGVLFTVRYSARPADEDHPYGHGKAEQLMTLVQMQLILLTAGFILVRAYQRLGSPEPIAVDWGLAAMAFAAASNTLVSIRLKRVATETRSTVLESEVLHLRSDTFASLGILVGLAAVRLTGWVWLDPIVAAAFTLIVVGQAARSLFGLVHPLMDGSLPPDEVERVQGVLHDHPQVRDYHYLRTRYVGSERHVELHILLDDDLSFVDAHTIAEHVEDEIAAALGGAVVNVHYEPYEAELEHRRQAHGPDGSAARYNSSAPDREPNTGAAG